MTQSIKHVDVLIIGAGLSGIGAAAHLVRECPNKHFAILESRDAIGGTWDLFQYPGIRSDSDMYTFGYSFKPWTEPKAISDGPSIKRYIEETAEEYGFTDRIRFRHKVLSAQWSTADAYWTVTSEQTDTGQITTMTASWVINATGYYRYDEGYRPTFEGEERFRGQIVHPQHWPEDLDYRGKRVVVIGSGATAVTLVPSMAEHAAHVTMLQRTPTYIASVSGSDPLAKALRRVPSAVSYPILRWKNMLSRQLQYSLSRKNPELVRSKLRKDAVALLPDGYDVDTHFNPPYDPWDQRICAVPDGDMFQVIRDGKASIVTDRIRSFTEDGINLESGEHIPADIIVTATGLNLQWFGGMKLSVDGQPVELGERFAYKGMMVSGVPNLSMVTGYTNNSWTLKADLVSRYVCHLMRYLDDNGYVSATPITPVGETPQPFLDLDSGYIKRGVDSMAKQGTALPWRLYQNYVKDLRVFNARKIRDEHMSFQRRGEAVPEGLRAPETQIIEVNGQLVRFRDEGQGVPVVMVHGIGRSLEDWMEQHELLRGKGYRLISVDLAGFGESGPLQERYTLPALGRFLGDFLDAVKVSEPAHLVGNSLGGAVVMQLAVQQPDRVRSLVLVGSAGFGREVALPVRLMSVRPIGEAMLSKPSRAASRRLEESLFHNPDLVTPDRVELGYQLSVRPGGSQVFLDTAAALGTFRGTRKEWRQDLLSALAAQAVPTLVVWGEQDKIFPFSHLAAAGQHLPHAYTHAFPEAGHMPQVEQATDFADVVTDFWSQAPVKLTSTSDKAA